MSSEIAELFDWFREDEQRRYAPYPTLLACDNQYDAMPYLYLQLFISSRPD
jgi:hypothetical protein